MPRSVNNGVRGFAMGISTVVGASTRRSLAAIILLLVALLVLSSSVGASSAEAAKRGTCTTTMWKSGLRFSFLGPQGPRDCEAT
jgi:hypothetical protein